MDDQSGYESNLHLACKRAGDSFEAITEFRGKLLILLPLAIGTAAFLLLERAPKPTDGSHSSDFWDSSR
jgi:hypothetical protein